MQKKIKMKLIFSFAVPQGLLCFYIPFTVTMYACPS